MHDNTNTFLAKATEKQGQADRMHRLLTAQNIVTDVASVELAETNDVLQDTHSLAIRQAGRIASLEEDAKFHMGKHHYFKAELDQHESEDAEAIDLLGKALKTLNLSPAGARKLITEAIDILNPPKPDDNTPAPF